MEVSRGKSLINGPCSIAMFDYRRVKPQCCTTEFYDFKVLAANRHGFFKEMSADYEKNGSVQANVANISKE